MKDKSSIRNISYVIMGELMSACRRSKQELLQFNKKG